MPFGLKIISKEEYYTLIQERGLLAETQQAVQQLEGRNAALGLRIEELQEELSSLSSALGSAEDSAEKYHNLYADQVRITKNLEADQESEMQILKMELRNDFQDALAEREAELARSVEQVESLGFENEALRKQVGLLSEELASLRESNDKTWVELNKAQAESLRLLGELDALKKPAPRTNRRGKR